MHKLFAFACTVYPLYLLHIYYIVKVTQKLSLDGLQMKYDSH